MSVIGSQSNRNIMRSAHFIFNRVKLKMRWHAAVSVYRSCLQGCFRNHLCKIARYFGKENPKFRCFFFIALQRDCVTWNKWNLITKKAATESVVWQNRYKRERERENKKPTLIIKLTGLCATFFFVLSIYQQSAKVPNYQNKTQSNNQKIESHWNNKEKMSFSKFT